MATYIIVSIIAYSLVYAVILNYIFKITFKKINKTKPFILNYSLVSFELLSQIEEVEMKVPPLGFPVLIFYFGCQFI